MVAQGSSVVDELKIQCRSSVSCHQWNNLIMTMCAAKKINKRTLRKKSRSPYFDIVSLSGCRTSTKFCGIQTCSGVTKKLWRYDWCHEWYTAIKKKNTHTQRSLSVELKLESRKKYVERECDKGDNRAALRTQVRPWQRKEKATRGWRFLHGSSSPVCPVVLRTHGGECLPSAMSDSEHWASPWITARPRRRRSAYDWALGREMAPGLLFVTVKKMDKAFGFKEGQRRMANTRG